MNRWWLMGGCVLALISCQPKDRDEAISESKGIARSLWITAVQEAQKVSSGTSVSAIKNAQKQMQALQAQLSKIKVPDEIDQLRLAHVDEELEKLDYGLEMAKLQKEIDKKVEDAKSTYESSKQSIAELRQKLKRADAEFRNLTESYAAAKENFEAAGSRIDDIRKRLAKAGAIVP